MFELFSQDVTKNYQKQDEIMDILRNILVNTAKINEDSIQLL